MRVDSFDGYGVDPAQVDLYLRQFFSRIGAVPRLVSTVIDRVRLSVNHASRPVVHDLDTAKRDALGQCRQQGAM
jgi:hypothetical protein